MSEEDISINLLNKQLSIKCSPDMKTDLLESARYLDEKLRSSCDNRQSPELNTIIMLTALNITYELLALQRTHSTYSEQLSAQLDKLDANILLMLEQSS